MYKCSPVTLLLLSFLSCGLVACGGGSTTPADTSPVATVTSKTQNTVAANTAKSHPGHYLVIHGTDMHTQLQSLGSNRVQGVVKHYAWNELEPTMGSYDFSQIRADLAETTLQKKYLLVQIDLEPRTDNKVLPMYLYQNQMVLPLQPGAQTLKIWDGYVIDRLKGLYAELAAHLDNEAFFEGLIIQPPGVQLTDQARAKYAYTVESHRDAIIDLLNSTKASFITANVFWSFATMTADVKLDTDIAAAVVGHGLVMGGADLRPENPNWQSVYQPLYRVMKGRATLFAMVSLATNSTINTAAKSQSQTALLESARERDVKYLLWATTGTVPATTSNPYADILSAIEAAAK